MVPKIRARLLSLFPFRHFRCPSPFSASMAFLFRLIRVVLQPCSAGRRYIHSPMGVGGGPTGCLGEPRFPLCVSQLRTDHRDHDRLQHGISPNPESYICNSFPKYPVEIIWFSDNPCLGWLHLLEYPEIIPIRISKMESSYLDYET